MVQVAIQKPGTSNRKQYKYDKVFGPESNQEQVYEDTKALIRSVLDGAIDCMCTCVCMCVSTPQLSAYAHRESAGFCFGGAVCQQG